jgi:hypothetical protein
MVREDRIEEIMELDTPESETSDAWGGRVATEKSGSNISFVDSIINKLTTYEYSRCKTPKLLGTGVSHGYSVKGQRLVIWDSGASKWMTPAKMPDMRKPEGHRSVTIADGSSMLVENTGVKYLQLGDKTRKVEGVLYLPKFTDVLISVSHVLQGTEDVIVFTQKGAYMVTTPHSETFIVGAQHNGLYHRVPTRPTKFRWVRVLNDTNAGKGLRRTQDERPLTPKSDQLAWNSSGGASTMPSTYNHGKGTFVSENTGHSADAGSQNPDTMGLATTQGKSLSSGELHDWFGHLNQSTLETTIRRNKTITLDSREGKQQQCKHCLKMKSRLKSVLSTDHPATRLLYRIHTDIIPLPVQDRKRHRYWIIFIDEWSRWIEVAPVKSKGDYVKEVKRLVARWENEHQEKGLKIAQIRSDRELVLSKEYNSWCAAHGIVPEASPAYVKEFNGLAEANVGTMKNMANCMRERASLPLKFTLEAVQYAAFIKNRVVHSFTDESPFSRWNGREADLRLIKPFGSEAWAVIPKEKRRLNQPEKASQGLFLGYEGNVIPLIYFLTRNRKQGIVEPSFHVRWVTNSFPGVNGGEALGDDANAESESNEES